MSRLEYDREPTFPINREIDEASPSNTEINERAGSLAGPVMPQELKDRAVKEFDSDYEDLDPIGEVESSRLSLANKYYESGMDDMALEFYQQFLDQAEFRPETHFEVYKNIGNIHVRLGDFDSGEEYYNKAYTLNPNSDTLEVNFGTLAIQRENYEEALKRFRRAIEINNNNDRAWVGLALIHRNYSDNELAWGNVEEALNINPKNLTAYQLAFEWANVDGKQSQLIERLEVDLIEDMSDVVRPWLLAQLYVSVRRFKAGMTVLENVLLVQKDHIAAQNLLDHCREKLQQQESRFQC